MNTEFLQFKIVLADVYFTKCFKGHTFYTIWFVGGACFHGFLADEDKGDFCVVPLPRSWYGYGCQGVHNNWHYVTTQLQHKNLHDGLVELIMEDNTFCPSRLRKSRIY